MQLDWIPAFAGMTKFVAVIPGVDPESMNLMRLPCGFALSFAFHTIIVIE